MLAEGEKGLQLVATEQYRPLEDSDQVRWWMENRTFTIAETFSQPEFPLTTSHDTMPGHQVPEHSHEFSEVVVVTAGHGSYRFGTVELPAEQGDVFVISPGERHALLSADQMQLAIFMFVRQPLLDHAFASEPSFIALFDLQPLLRPGPAHQRHLRLDEQQLALVLDLHHHIGEDSHNSCRLRVNWLWRDFIKS